MFKQLRTLKLKTRNSSIVGSRLIILRRESISFKTLSGVIANSVWEPSPSDTSVGLCLVETTKTDEITVPELGTKNLYKAKTNYLDLNFHSMFGSTLVDCSSKPPTTYNFLKPKN